MSATRTQIVEKARVMLKSGKAEVDVIALLTEQYDLNGDVAGIIAEAERSTADEHPHNTDAGNAARLARFYGDRVRYLFEQRSWLAWDGTRWEPDATGAVERYAKETVRRM